MTVKTGKIALAGALTAALSLALTPALSAVLGAESKGLDQSGVSLKMLGSIGSFTPVTHDEKLAKAYAQAARESQSKGFRFTPTSGSAAGNRSLTILVRTPNAMASALDGRSERVLPNLGVAPVAYRLGVTKGLARFTPGTRIESSRLDPIIEKSISEPVASFTLRPKQERFSANVQLEHREVAAASPAEDTPATLGTEPSYAVDLSSSYSLTRNLNLKAGVRYAGPNNRLAPTVTDQAQDSQAVYVGTTFKF
ncbi:hypothetical protein M2333_002566 [Sphingobium sp. B11D3B]|uniref:hypothetical protein n=1 Tax=Sphingobium sp. B11D3B TaxID=2940575 RepID=UPI002225B99B|nr:hypothetical protein [Sphingobium sp. B11D3B]MCW2389520.1 hypothetical protein [Sphingobium sp. B11D3B]